MVKVCVHRKKKKIPQGSYRVIKIGENAIQELLYETIIDRMEEYLDIADRTKTGGYTWKLDWRNRTLLFLVKGETPEQEIPDLSEIDLDVLQEKMEDTAQSMYQNNCRYREFDGEEIGRFQNCTEV